MADTMLEHLEHLADRLSQDDQRKLIEKLTQRLLHDSKGGSLRPYGLCRGEFVVSNDFNASLP